eukprot:352926-Chlamydomonas_euryale.AAC.9
MLPVLPCNIHPCMPSCPCARACAQDHVSADYAVHPQAPLCVCGAAAAGARPPGAAERDHRRVPRLSAAARQLGLRVALAQQVHREGRRRAAGVAGGGAGGVRAAHHGDA